MIYRSDVFKKNRDRYSWHTVINFSIPKKEASFKTFPLWVISLGFSWSVGCPWIWLEILYFQRRRNRYSLYFSHLLAVLSKIQIKILDFLSKRIWLATWECWTKNLNCLSFPHNSFFIDNSFRLTIPETVIRALSCLSSFLFKSSTYLLHFSK